MNVLTIVIAGFALLAGAIALLCAMAAVAIQWKDRRGRDRDAVTELWVYATVFGGISFFTALTGGFDANYGKAVASAVWAVPCILVAGWLACFSIRRLRRLFHRAFESDPAIDDRDGLSEALKAHTRLTTLPVPQPNNFESEVRHEQKVVHFVMPRETPIVEALVEMQGPKPWEKRHKPPPDVLYFRESRRCAKLGLYLTGLDWFRDRVESEDGMVLAVETQGVHVGAIGSIQAGTAFFPWVAMQSVTWSMPPPKGRQVGGGIGIRIVDKYRKYPCKEGYLPMPGALWFEDRQGFLDAVGRSAPEGNPLRKFFENIFFRFFFLWFDRLVLAIVAAGFFFYRA